MTSWSVSLPAMAATSRKSRVAFRRTMSHALMRRISAFAGLERSNRRCLDRFDPNLVPHRREDAVKAAEDDDRSLHSSRRPACGRLQLREHLVEMVDQAGHDVVGVEGAAVPRRDRGRRPADQRRVGQDRLEARGCREKLFPVRELLDHR